jgi:hypothetical protein
MKTMKKNGGKRGAGGQLPFASLVDAISISNHMAKHRSVVSFLSRLHNVGSACNAGGSSSLHTRMNAAARLIRNILTTDLKISHRFLQHASNTQRTQASAAHSTARAPLQPHLHFLHATPRHTLHYPRSPEPRRPVHHVHTGRRGGQSTARERHTGEHEAHSSTRRTFRDNAAEGRQRLLPTVMRKKTTSGV